jgi:hypothetical protein
VVPVRNALIAIAVAAAFAADATASTLDRNAALLDRAVDARPTRCVRPTCVTVQLDDWVSNDTRTVGRATFRQRPGPAVAIDIRLNVPNDYRANDKVFVFGGQTQGIEWPRTDCDVVWNNHGGNVRYSLGRLKHGRLLAIVRGTTLKRFLRRADSIAMGYYLTICGDV